MRPGVVLCLLCLAACSRRSPGPESAAKDAGDEATPASIPSAASAALPDRLDAAPPTATSDGPDDAPPPRPTFDAGVNPCKLTYGPVQQTPTGDAALVTYEGTVEVIRHTRGIPEVTKIAPPPASPSPLGRVTLEGDPPRASGTACALGGGQVFCMDPQGAVTKTPHAGGVGAVVAKARPGTRVAAATLDQTHALVAYLVETKTAEGVMTQAWAAVDGAPAVRLSDEGSGATVVALAPRGKKVMALLIDGRSAMTPVHARLLSWKDGQLELGADVVAFVGGGAERQTSGVLAGPTAGFALLPVAGESGFGMAAVKLGDPPATDEKTTWSLYPNGLDPAPIAATTGPGPIRVARVRPVDTRPEAARGLELGKLEETGAYTPYGFIATTGRASAVEVTTDASGALWLYYTDTAGSWLERRQCPL